MAVETIALPARLITVLALLVGGVILQIFLSRRRSRWPGLVLPLLTFLYSVLLVLNVRPVDGGFPWMPILACLILGNLPTLVLLAIYRAAREKYRTKNQIDKMNIDDL